MTDSAVSDEPRLVRNEPESRYEVWVGETRAGIATYRESDSRVTFVHTIVDKAFGGHGLGSRLAAFALEDTVSRGKRIVPRCPFIREYLQSHHEFDDHIDDLPERTRS
ncbi:putative GNAT family acetyltransferase [Mycetocola sp. CAN_C7]|uniref:GNAT family N-acetyltransferase n=1 Tax=Mycetocola sp. CAN_C7 TaxID=2787724 RepID=UPI0018CAA97E